MFDDKILLITGGTGSFGQAVLRRFLNSSLKEIRVFSRDEKKQEDMRIRYGNPKLKFHLGDVRDPASVNDAMTGVDYCFHAAALKQVPSCEFYPMQAVKTNIEGTENVLNAAITYGVARVICLSTDKAVYPINAMGLSKALMEKVAIAKARAAGSQTVISTCRYGNVMASRGSVIPLFVDQIRRGQAITVTDPNMTRFMMSLDDAVDLVLFAFEHGRNGDIFVQKSPASTIGDLGLAIAQIMDKPNHEIRTIGTRHGEKLYETLLSREEMASADDLGPYYRVPPDNRDLNYTKFVDSGETKISVSEDYTSHNTRRLDLEGTKALVLGLRSIQAILAGASAEDE
jgi:UDP-glucose 4-epimerase